MVDYRLNIRMSFYLFIYYVLISILASIVFLFSTLYHNKKIEPENVMLKLCKILEVKIFRLLKQIAVVYKTYITMFLRANDIFKNQIYKL